MPARNNRVVASRLYPQKGFSLPATLVAALLLTVSLLGLLQYHQVLQQSFLLQWQQRQAWRLVMQQLEAYEAGVQYTNGFGRGWRSGLSVQRLTVECRKVTATVVTPGNYQARLTRWFCPAAQSVNE
ncbi:prepilin-type N-terminal cleavage/methylation domain-containing protein [Brenneria rubrifaciens]|uniref:prepilin-type N-terminal cleavage/methylation domain-containing protein n=1 Tax=Brenneria rubrifaciens TaxID=55213 RepID=UPI001FEAD06E|nr:prepilin-type N-terminal cleavage/methylation domain-containing protein [Brenneria rubrifaciens]